MTVQQALDMAQIIIEEHNLSPRREDETDQQFVNRLEAELKELGAHERADDLVDAWFSPELGAETSLDPLGSFTFFFDPYQTKVDPAKRFPEKQLFDLPSWQPSVPQNPQKELPVFSDKDATISAVSNLLSNLAEEARQQLLSELEQTLLPMPPLTHDIGGSGQNVYGRYSALIKIPELQAEGKTGVEIAEHLQQRGWDIDLAKEILVAAGYLVKIQYSGSNRTLHVSDNPFNFEALPGVTWE